MATTICCFLVPELSATKEGIQGERPPGGRDLFVYSGLQRCPLRALTLLKECERAQRASARDCGRKGPHQPSPAYVPPSSQIFLKLGLSSANQGKLGLPDAATGAANLAPVRPAPQGARKAAFCAPFTSCHGLAVCDLRNDFLTNCPYACQNVILLQRGLRDLRDETVMMRCIFTSTRNRSSAGEPQ